MDLPANLLPTLRAVIALMIPEDHDPGGLDLGCEAFILERMRDSPFVSKLYTEGLEKLREMGFMELGPEDRDAMLKEIASGSWPDDWPVHPGIMVWSLTDRCIEAAYTHPKGLDMVGFKVTG